MHHFLRVGIPFCVLAIAILVGTFVSDNQTVQVVVAALVGGIPMWLIGNLPHIPNIVIEESGRGAICSLSSSEVTCSIFGQIVNKSAMGEGEIRSLRLILALRGGKTLVVPVRRGDPSIVGYRVKPHGIYPDDMLFFQGGSAPSGAVVEGAAVELGVVGQKVKTYEIGLAKAS